MLTFPFAARTTPRIPVIPLGGAGALLSKCIKKSEVVAYDDLGTEAIRRLEVENFPVIVVIDSQGNNLYETAIEEYKEG